jgi:hypothetical protein
VEAAVLAFLLAGRTALDAGALADVRTNENAIARMTAGDVNSALAASSAGSSALVVAVFQKCCTRCFAHNGRQISYVAGNVLDVPAGKASTERLSTGL